MTKVFADMSMSLDGFIAGPRDSPERPVGHGGESLHRWMFGLAPWRRRRGMVGGEVNLDAEIEDETYRNTGAVVMGRRTFDNLNRLWGDIPPFGTSVFVMCGEASEPVVKAGGTTYTFVADGIERGLELARAAAGDQDVSVLGGGNVVRQYIQAGLLDEIQIHLVPILLCGGIRLFDDLDIPPVHLERTRVVESPNVTHLRFRVLR